MSTIATINGVTIHRGIAGQISADVDVTYSESGTRQAYAFVGSIYGGPVFLVLHGRPVRVDAPDRFGTFGSDPRGWIDRFYGTV